MAVINTNYLSLVAQGNLNKSQSALGSAIERLSSGLRINSAKDDAAGQAIANRFTANINGLTQAGRNANDGISIAQTTEGALNEINNNLQRIRELSVQASNGTNSDSDLKSIQDEITQRLDEINRVSAQTQFNGVNVLAKSQGLQIQVGANDGQTIDIDLKEITSQTLGLGTFNVNGLTADHFSAALTDAGTGHTSATAVIAANSADPLLGGGPAGANPSGITATGVYTASTAASASGYAVKASNGNFYALTQNTITNQWTWDSSSTALNETTDISGVASASATTMAVGTLTTNTGAASTASGTFNISNNTSSISFDTSAIYVRNDKVGTGGVAEYAVKGSDGNYYALTTTRSTASGGSFSFSIDSNSLTQLSPTNVDSTPTTSIQLADSPAPSAASDLYNEDLTIPAANGLYALSDGSGYVVKGSNGTYYNATVGNGGNVTWDSSAAGSVVDSSNVDTSTAITSFTNAPTTGSYTGLAAGESLHSYADADGNTQYVVIGGTSTAPTYTKATLGTADATTGDIAVTKATGAGSTITVRTDSPLDALDNALQQVDSMRSALGAVQNRFESTIANLNNTVTNLSAARSRIQDADYATEVSNMTRAQILQQAGTAVLAQANQVPQTVLSLLR